MPSSQFRRRICKRASASLAALGTIAFLALASGAPIPLGAAKDFSTPYPCMHCSCGCVSAEQCWSNCCCHTDAEKLAWARREGVTPPAFVAERMRRAEQLLEDPAEEGENKAPAAHSCCSASKSCCEPEPPKLVRAAAASCCASQDSCSAWEESKPAECGEPPASAPSQNENTPNDAVVLLQQLRCQGHAQISGLPIAIPPRPVVWTLHWLVFSHCKPPPACYRASLREPPVPPPQWS
jgi:hypothetical protein